MHPVQACRFAIVAMLLSLPVSAFSQTSAPAGLTVASASAVPSMVSFSGTLKDASGRTIASQTGVTFLIYKDEQGGAPLWLETQSVAPDKNGHYSVQLGAASAHGLPADIFQNGGSRWLGVQIANEAEQSRVLLVAVPYAMKAVDAETLGGLPASAYALAKPINTANSSTTTVSKLAILAEPVKSSNSPKTPPPPGSSPVTTSGGTVNAIPVFSTASDIENSPITTNGAGGAAQINIGTSSTASVLNVYDTSNLYNPLNLHSAGTATAASGKNSRAESFEASVFSSTSGAGDHLFFLQAEPQNNDTTSPSATLNLLAGTSYVFKPTETGIHFDHTGAITANQLSINNANTNQILAISTAANASPIISIADNSSGTGFAMEGIAFGSTTTSPITNSAGVAGISNGNSPGVYGVTASSSSNGVLGVNTNGLDAGANVSFAGAGVYGVGPDLGVVGQTYYGVEIPNVGVLGELQAPSSMFSQAADADIAVGTWGEGGAGSGSVRSFGVVGTIDNGTAGIFLNSSPTLPTLSAMSENAGIAFIAGGGGYITEFYKYCQIDNSGNLSCSGSSNALVPLDGGKRTVALSAIESPVNWFEDAGSGQLVNGRAVITLDPDFLQTVNAEKDYKVFPVPNGDCKGLYVTSKTATSFEVRELGGGTSNVAFDYRILALRRNYESVRFADHTHELDGMKKLAALRHTAATRGDRKVPMRPLQPALPPLASALPH